ncbi:hypothetical protein SmJEL517_g04512 [Synchytrium microbalum]|uniref:J domain-containing protein n=1 Tax=Synchytrium microbalum TaxID=1806994 RepID=A0A507C4B0_9FUNG|nr:uncharacterized protein SmJEL517_g04512 [Synchytrium microbalum]TPX32363.1 hypothetical protein SmJEL517_g04512 [Synchytrium microbalum]
MTKAARPKAASTSKKASAMENDSLYTALSVESTATQASFDQIKQSYRKLALQFHPDKVQTKTDQEREEVTIKFQKIVAAYAILSDQVKRKRYDDTGEADDGSVHFPDGGDFDAWDAFYKELWAGMVTKERIEEFAQQYKESDEEKQDILKAYTESEGSMDFILENVMLANAIDDEDRFRNIIEQAIKSKQVERYKAFKLDPKAAVNRKKEAAKEAKAAERLRKELDLKNNSDGDLQKMLTARNANRMNDLVARLEQKYGGNAGSSGSNSKKANNKGASKSSNNSRGGLVGHTSDAKPSTRAKGKEEKADDEEDLGDEDSEVDEEEEDWEDEEMEEGNEASGQADGGDEGGDEGTEGEDEEEPSGDVEEEEETNEEEEDEESAALSKKRKAASEEEEEADELADDDDNFIEEDENEATTTATTEAAATNKSPTTTTNRAEPSEAEFLAIRQKLEAARKGKVAAEPPNKKTRTGKS